MKFKYYIALWASKLAIVALKITKHNATNFPGIVALKICPDFLKYVAKPEKIIAVSGTNGKTTVSNMISDILRADGKNVMNNSKGSNINTGIVTAFIYGTSVFGKCKKEIAVLEVDERSVIRIFPYVHPDIMLVTNLTNDSIMRNAHPEYIRDFLNKYIPKTTKMVLNADDLITSSVAVENDRVFFGIDKMETDVTECINLRNDCQICPKCHHKLKYEYLRYHHIGKAYCPSCGFKAPSYDYEGKNDNLTDMTIEVKDKEGSAVYSLPNESIFNIYNLVSAVAVLRELGYSHEKLVALFSKLGIDRTRFNEIKVGSNTLIKLLTKEKNALASSRVFDYIHTMPGDKEIIWMNSCQGDIESWSENTCWLYDCDVEFLNHESIKHIIVCGPRRFDHKLRLKLAGVPDDRITMVEKEVDAPSKLRWIKDDYIYVLYGTDSFDLGMKVADIVEGLMQERKDETNG